MNSYTVLLLDDDERFRKMVTPRLSAKGLQVLEAGCGKDAMELLSAHNFDCLIVDGVLPDTDGIKWITRFRASGGTAPIIFISAHWQPVDIYHVLTRDLSVTQIIHKPVIPTVFAEQVYSEITRPHWSPAAEEEPADTDDAITLAMQELTKEYLQELPGELAKMSHLIKAAKQSASPNELLKQVLMSAHKLRGTAGSFGLETLGDSIGQIEDIIRQKEEQGDAPDEAFYLALMAKLAEGYVFLDERNTLPAQKPPPNRAISRILVVDEDEKFLSQVERAARQRMIEVIRASNSEQVLDIISHSAIDAVLVDIKMAGYKSFELARSIRELTGDEMPIAFTSDDSNLDDRLLAAHMGASLYLSKPIDPDALEDALLRLMILSSRERPRVLIVDDDTQYNRRVARMLFEKGMETQTLSDPSQILEKLQGFVPEVLLLDAMMPYISGFDICKMLRTIPRWQELPIIFVSAQTGLENRIAAFACGADDYLPKPTADEELVTRITLRVERARLLKERVERDPVTGLLLRRSFMERFNASLSSAKRTSQPISLILFDLDKFKSINDTHGHLAGDAVLAGLGRLMLNRFRVEDLRGRWGGDEFVLALIGATKDQSALLMKNFLDEYRKLDFSSEGGEIFHAALSAGVAEYPSDNDTTYALLRVADQRLYEAKNRGRNCVVADRAEIPHALGHDGAEKKV